MTVEVILKTKVEGLGAEADVVNVRPGYARNFLFPQGFATTATAASKRQIEELKKKRAEREAQELNDSQELAGKIGKLKLSFVMAAGSAQSKLFGSVTTQDIADKLKEAGYPVDRKKIEIVKAIKDLGNHEVLIKLHSDIQVKLNVEVVGTAKEAPVKEEASAVKKGKKPASKKAEK